MSQSQVDKKTENVVCEVR